MKSATNSKAGKRIRTDSGGRGCNLTWEVTGHIEVTFQQRPKNGKCHANDVPGRGTARGEALRQKCA